MHPRQWLEEKRFTPNSPREQHLQKMCNSLLHLYDNMHTVEVWEVDQTIESPWKYEENMFKKGLYRKTFDHNVRTAPAYVLGDSRICLKKQFLDNASEDEIVGTLKHELIHAWMSWKGLDEGDNLNHGPIFQRKANELGVPYWEPEVKDMWISK